MSKPLTASAKKNKLSSSSLISELKHVSDPIRAKNLLRFFKTAPGQYGAGDHFWGITVPQSRVIAKSYRALSLSETIKVLHSPIHECRLTALLVLVEQYSLADEAERSRIVKTYLQNTKWINNWDLVDLSAPKIVGDYYLRRDRKDLERLARSKNLWEKRIAVLACFPLIKTGRYQEIFSLTDQLMNDKHDLMHKALGWMLREVGKKDQRTLEQFLWPRIASMPRTMLRYAIERFPEKLRQKYLKK